MEKDFLYINRKGKQVNIHSYSAGDTFSTCRRKYKLQKIDGWQMREHLASLEFGKCIESGIKYFYNNKKKGAAEYFKNLWEKFQNNTELVYTDREGSWEELNIVGYELLSLFEIIESKFIKSVPKFQLNYKKQIGTITYTAYIDMMVKEGNRNRLIDIKTSSVSLPEIDNLVSLDEQLREYAWVSGIENVGLLWLVKTGSSLKGGDSVSLIKQVENLPAAALGEKFIVYEKKKETVALLSLSDYNKYSKEKETEAITSIKWDERAIWVPNTAITKQKIQFLTGVVPKEEFSSIEWKVTKQIRDIMEEEAFPKDPGIRFPNSKCTMCPMRGICLGNQELRDKLVYRPDEDWLDELEN